MENNNSSNTKIIIAVIIVIALVLVGYGFYRSRVSTTVDLSPTPGLSPSPEEQFPGEIVNTKHQFMNGKHTYVGVFELPNPCTSLSYDVVRDTLNPSRVELNFKTMDAGEGCAQVITPKPFKVTFDAPEKITVIVTRDGKSVKFNLFEVPAKENIDTFEIEIKG